MASAVARWTAQGKTVTYVLASRGEAGIDGIHPDEAAPIREREERAGTREVGVDVVEFLDHTDGVLEYGPRLRCDIARVIRQRPPEVMICGTYDVRMIKGRVNQADHRTVGLAALDAARDAGNRWIFPELLDEGLAPWDGVRLVCYSGGTKWTHGVDVTGPPLERSIASLAAHAKYTEGLGLTGPPPRALLTWLARQSGLAMGVEAAALFDVHVLHCDAPPPWNGQWRSAGGRRSGGPARRWTVVAMGRSVRRSCAPTARGRPPPRKSRGYGRDGSRWCSPA